MLSRVIAKKGMFFETQCTFSRLRLWNRWTD